MAISQVFQTSLQLTVKPGYDGLYSIIGYHVSYQTVDTLDQTTLEYQNVSEITLISLRPQTYYMINVSARNRLGRSSPATVIVMTNTDSKAIGRNMHQICLFIYTFFKYI